MSYPDGVAIIRPKATSSIEDVNALSARLTNLRKAVLRLSEKVARENTELPSNAVKQRGFGGPG